ncbi:DNA-directed RNA polymerase IV subunit 1 isoform X1 [Benincasa hispida]|uniref:DNA-directed RNA polymerase IV subunit 1 isoform X1 n=2 Tax=Benincasa hispida TaxID=102211 RepID=UPI0019021C9B|nr:DNA-directed RNA polymerase IV subunit 1 isoform X1 [Benincasa hispida]XP_038905039.1 DNA-directed RNA polymerase IV subunit 1 isoform X1 [Benincasa hispida]XP_038905040.1 DNA-directed RNA polymerase IV subunit 1 isoform X1 [Benincasa hispida]XP_038905041.1 DNA-directed RNA polymerase IV subunit 1 isoform X1 [Benincasa hispida]
MSFAGDFQPEQKVMIHMEDEQDGELPIPSGLLTGINFSVATQQDTENIAVLTVDAASEVSDPKLGLPNPSYQCTTCGASSLKSCEGHFGVIKFPYTIIHPYFLSEVAQVLNKVCPGCKSIRQELWGKVEDPTSDYHRPKGCRYCFGSLKDWYPPMRFKLSTTDMFRKSMIMVEVKENMSKKYQKKVAKGGLPSDYWNFIPKDEQQEESYCRPNRKILTHAQVHYLLKDIDPKFLKKFVPATDSLFLNSFPVTPNSHRVTELTHSFSNGQRLIFDERTRAYKKVVDFRGTANELGSRILDCLKISKLSPEKLQSKDLVYQQKKIKDTATSSYGLRWIKDVVLGKRSDHCFRMVVVGDPNIELSEIGIPCHVAERLQISEHLSSWNMKKLSTSCYLNLVVKGEIFVRREGRLVRVRNVLELNMGDTIYRPLADGDVVLVNRPPSIHQHSLIALYVKLLPVSSVLSLNPLCCSPFRGDFDGDCLHGYVPQSLEARVEVRELVSLDRQLINGQSGRNLLSLSHDSLTAAHLIMEDGVSLNAFQMQQLQMLALHQLLPPAIVKAPLFRNCAWTGKQLFSILLPPDFDYSSPSHNVFIKNGELISSEGSYWLRDSGRNLFQALIEHCEGKTLDYLHDAQGVLCEWLSMRGLSVSLSDLYLSVDSHSHKNMMDDIFCGLQEAEETCNLKQLMVDSHKDILTGNDEDNQHMLSIEMERLIYEKQKSVALNQASVDAFKKVFRDIQNLVYKYSGKDNSLLTMFKAGSKGNLLKLVQHSMCLGLQHSLVFLSFSLPHKLSCSAWNSQKMPRYIQKDGLPDRTQSFIPYAVVENSFLSGLNPFECFAHSVTNRDSSFSDNAEVPGTLTRKLTFLMRDIYTAYDGTVRNAYGNQLVQFSYDIDRPTSVSNELDSENNNKDRDIGGHPVGSLAACAMSEAAYSALDQPISLLEASPLLNLKRVLECGSKRNSTKQTFSLFLSEKLSKRSYGFEYGALGVKNHLERVMFKDIVSTVMIIFSPQPSRKKHFSPWVCHFHVCKEILKKRRLKMNSVIHSLNIRCDSVRQEGRMNLPSLQIISQDCPLADSVREDGDTVCLTVTIAENTKNSFLQLDFIQDLLIHFLLGTVIRGFAEIDRVDIAWNDRPKVPKPRCNHGELYLRVTMSGEGNSRFWATLVNNCLPVMDLIDWSRSHPDNTHSLCLAYGIDSGWKYFLNSLVSATLDIGKTIRLEHLLLIANSLSATGEFVGLNVKGLSHQREHALVKTPFMQACFSSPGACFVKAAKAGSKDNLSGSLDALAWGRIPSLGTGGQFDILYSGRGHELNKPVDVYNLLGGQSTCEKQNAKIGSLDKNNISEKYSAQLVLKNGGSTIKGLKKLDNVSKSILREFLTLNDIQKLSFALRTILHKYSLNERLNEVDKSTLMMALYFHPHRDEKIGVGAQDIKVGSHSKYQNTRCFVLIRSDGTTEDFSYHKCVLGALEIIAPHRVKGYQSKWMQEKFE